MFSGLRQKAAENGLDRWLSHRSVKHISVADKIVISVKLIAPVAWIFDSKHVTVALRAKPQ